MRRVFIPRSDGNTKRGKACFNDIIAFSVVDLGARHGHVTPRKCSTVVGGGDDLFRADVANKALDCSLKILTSSSKSIEL